MKSPNSHIIIHAFALTHALVSLLCQLGGIVVSNLKRPKLSPEAGSNDYLLKPIGKEALDRAVGRCRERLGAGG